MPNLLCQGPVVDPSLVEPAPLAPDGEAEDREDHGQFDPAPKAGCCPPAPVRHEPHPRGDGRHPLQAEYHREGGSIPVGVVGRQVVEPPMGRGPTLRSIGPECRGRVRPTGPARARRWPRDSSRGSGAPPDSGGPQARRMPWAPGTRDVVSPTRRKHVGGAAQIWKYLAGGVGGLAAFSWRAGWWAVPDRCFIPSRSKKRPRDPSFGPRFARGASGSSRARRVFRRGTTGPVTTRLSRHRPGPSTPRGGSTSMRRSGSCRCPSTAPRMTRQAGWWPMSFWPIGSGPTPPTGTTRWGEAAKHRGRGKRERTGSTVPTAERWSSVVRSRC